MKVLIIGSGGREHALAWACAKSSRVTAVVCAPGNGGIASVARCVPARQSDLDDLLRVVAAEKPDLTVVGPELPLSLGLADELHRRSLPVFGPTRAAAMLETSKAFAKRFMQRHNIPTAEYAAVSSEAEALESLALFHLPRSGQGRRPRRGQRRAHLRDKTRAEAAIAGLFSGKTLGTAERSIVIEEFLEGEEVSFLSALRRTSRHPARSRARPQTHRRRRHWPEHRRHGRLHDGFHARRNHAGVAGATHCQPTIDGMAAEDTPFVGVLYCGLMMTARGPMVSRIQRSFRRPRDPGDFGAARE